MTTSLKLVLIGALGAYCFLYGVLASLIRRRDDASRTSPVGQLRTNAVEALLFHTDNLFHARVNFFLAVEALLFTALATIWSSGPLPRETVAFFGAVSTVLIFYTNVNLAKKLDWLMNALKELPEATAYNRYRSIHTSWVPRTLTLFYSSMFCRLRRSQAGW